MYRYLPIRRIYAREVLDSRSNPTVEVEVTVGEPMNLPLQIRSKHRNPKQKSRPGKRKKQRASRNDKSEKVGRLE